MDPEVEKIRDAAMARAKDSLPSGGGLYLEGGAIEAMARALERHADELDRFIRSLDIVGYENCLGKGTSEGSAVTKNITIAIHNHERSVVKTYEAQRAKALQLAAGLRQMDRGITTVERENTAQLRPIGMP